MSDFSRRDVLQHGALLAGAGLFAGLPACTPGAIRRFDLTAEIAQAPIKGLGENAAVRVGLIGHGGRGGGLLGHALKCPGVKVTAICDMTPDHLAKGIERVKEAQGHTPDAYGDDPYAYRTLLAREDIDAVIIAVPCDLHAPMYLDCAKAGKHFYGEKPAAITKTDADKLVAAVPKAGIVGQIGFQRRASVRYHEEIKLIKEGLIGDMLNGHAAWDNAWGPLRGWFGHMKRSGDWMLEQACHTWDVLNWVTGTLPVAAYGAGRADIYVDPEKEPDRDVTDFYVATVIYPNLNVRYSHSWGAPNDGRFIGVYERIVGTLGGADLETGDIIFREKDKPAQKIGEKEPNHTQASIDHFFDCVRKGQVPNSTVFNGRDATLVGLLIRTAVREERFVTMEEIMKSV